jgi:hypothetical protein
MNGAVDKCVGVAGEYPDCVCGNKERICYHSNITPKLLLTGFV